MLTSYGTQLNTSKKLLNHIQIYLCNSILHC